MKLNKRRIIKKRQDIEVLLDDCMKFVIPSKYISEMVIRNRHIIKLKISKKYFNVIKGYNYLSGYFVPFCDNDKAKFLTTMNVVMVSKGDKDYCVPAIANKCMQFWSGNILQTTIEDDSYIIFKWDLNKKNKIVNVRIDEDYTEHHLYLDKSYKGVKVENYHKVIYY